MNDVVSTLRRPRGEYGYDGDYRVVPAPVVATIFALICLVIAALAVVSALYGHVVWAVVAACVAALLIVNGFLFIRVTRVGKFEVWARILAGLGLRGDERVRHRLRPRRRRHDPPAVRRRRLRPDRQQPGHP